MKASFLPGYDPSEAPTTVLDYPSMTSRNEKALLYWLARHAYKGIGVIVDAGVFLGGSTNAFATGLKDNPTALARVVGKPIHSYDIAIWVSGMDRYLERPAVKRALRGMQVKKNRSFLPVLRKLLGAHLDLIDFRIGDIAKIATGDAPIEIAFYDCLKTNERDLAAFRAFAPAYIPGHSIIVQQDYFFEGAYYNKIRQEYFSSYFTYLGAEATSAFFRYETKIPPELIELDPVSSLSIDEKVGLLDKAVKRASHPKARIYTELANVGFLLQEGLHKEATKRLVEVEESISNFSFDEITKRPSEILQTLRARAEKCEG
jgi:hypothetical protein